MKQILILLGAISQCLGQSINSPALDWIQTDGTGAYRYGYATGDNGRHYHVQSASADNTVAGKFGYKEPGTGRDLQTTYTAGKRGFRARGPHIARRMDLSQIKPPFSRPNDDGQYHPELDNFFDPNEDRGFDYSYRTTNQIKEEHANRVGDVQGRYSYLDDIGFRHNVHYIAGSKTGFVVSNPVPDTFAQARGGPLYYVGKSGGAKVRGFSAVQKNLNGAYRFLASGPDHKRSEISDASGNRRGVYTYLDDKGVQHTVEYIAGPKIGYKVINNKKGVNYNPVLPFFVDSSTVLPLFPASPSSGSNTGKPSTVFPTPISPSSTPSGFPSGSLSSFGSGSFDGSSGSSGREGGGGGGGHGAGGEESPFPNDDSFPTLDGSFPSVPSSGGTGLLSSGTPTSSSSIKPLTPLFKPTTVKPPLFKPSEKPSSIHHQSDSLDASDKDFPSPTFPSSTFPLPSSSPFLPDPFHPSLPKWGYDYDYFLSDPFNTNKDWSKPVKDSSKKPAPSSRPPFVPFPDFFPSAVPDVNLGIPDPFNERLNTAESGSALRSPSKNNSKIDCNCTIENDPKTKDLQSGAGHRDDTPRSRSDTGAFQSTSDENFSKEDTPKQFLKTNKNVGYHGRGTVKFGGVKKDEWHKFKHGDGYFAIPPGVAVRAHVQSLDIVPYNKRFISPGEALENQEIHEKHHRE